MFTFPYASQLRAALLLWLAILWAGSGSTPAFAAETSEERTPRRLTSDATEVVNFSLLDYKGQHYELRRAKAKAVVLFFTSFGCSCF